MVSFFRRLKERGSGPTIKFGHFAIIPDVSFLLLAPASLYVVATVYVPIMGAALNKLSSVGNFPAILVLMFLSLFLHSLAHMSLSWWRLFKPIFLCPLGDPAHYLAGGA